MVIAPLVALAVVSAPLPPQATTPNAAAATFLDAFKHMDESRFDQFFAPDVTMFFPGGPFPHGRIDGRDAVLSAFHSFFKVARNSGRTELKLAPLKQRIQQYGGIAIVTFQLDQEGAVGRRTLVLREVSGEWRIVHFHASTIEP